MNSFKETWLKTSTAKDKISDVEAKVDANSTKVTNLSNITIKNNLSNQTIPNLRITNNVTNDNDAATKAYVDNKQPLVEHYTRTINVGSEIDIKTIGIEKVISVMVWRKRTDNKWCSEYHQNLGFQILWDNKVKVYNNAAPTNFTNDFKITITTIR